MGVCLAWSEYPTNGSERERKMQCLYCLAPILQSYILLLHILDLVLFLDVTLLYYTVLFRNTLLFVSDAQ